MATIGTFTLADGAYSGAIKTLTLNVRNAQLRPNEKADDKAPDYRLGITFAGRAWSEHKLLRLAYAYEQASNMRKPPPGLPAGRPLGLKVLGRRGRASPASALGAQGFFGLPGLTGRSAAGAAPFHRADRPVPPAAAPAQGACCSRYEISPGQMSQRRMSQIQISTGWLLPANCPDCAPVPFTGLSEAGGCSGCTGTAAGGAGACADSFSLLGATPNCESGSPGSFTCATAACPSSGSVAAS